MTLDRNDHIHVRKNIREILRESSIALIAESQKLRQYSRELIQANRRLRLSQDTQGRVAHGLARKERNSDCAESGEQVQDRQRQHQGSI